MRHLLLGFLLCTPLLGGCLHSANMQRSAALSTETVDVYLSSVAYADGALRRLVIERVGPIVGRCNDVHVDVFEYSPQGALTTVTREHNRCGVKISTQRYSCTTAGSSCSEHAAFDFDADGYTDFEATRPRALVPECPPRVLAAAHR